MRSKCFLFVLRCFLCVCLGSTPLPAQTPLTSSLVGTATDPSGNALPYAQIVAVTQGGKTYQATTDRAGNYRFAALSKGHYRLTASLSGFTSQSKDISVANSGIIINFSLVLAPLETSVIVTAGKRDEELGQIPTTAEVLPAKEVQQDGIQQLDDLNGRVSNYLLSSTGNRAVFSFFSMRGNVNNDNSVDPSTAVYVDGVPVGDFFSIDQKLVDVQRIEVLKEPQGTLYGANSAAGLINVITRDPGDTFHGAVGGVYGGYNGYESTFSFSGPIVPRKLFISTAGSIDGRDGFVRGYVSDKKFNNQFGYAGRVRVDWVPANQWRVSVVQSGGHIDDGGAYVLIPTYLAGFNQIPYLTHPVGKYEQAMDIDGTGHSGANAESVQASYFGSHFDFVNTSSRRENSVSYTEDGDYSPSRLYAFNDRFAIRAWNEEARIQSSENSKHLIWIAGYSFGDDERKNPVDLPLLPDNDEGAPPADWSARLALCQ